MSTTTDALTNDRQLQASQDFLGLSESSVQAAPQDLQDLHAWIVWKREKRNGKTTKVPYDAKTTGAYAKSNDPGTWTSFDRAVEVATDPSNGYDGVGLMLQGTDLVGTDFDGVLHDGVAEPYVLDILEKLGNPYCEITPSGDGLRAFVRCEKLPAGQRKFSGNKYGAEIYSGFEGGRYLTVTGNHFSGEGVPKIEDITLAYVLISQINKDKFKKLWMGDSTAYGDGMSEADQSRADLALLDMLAPLLNHDPQKVEAIFGASKPGQRKKWIDRKDYRDKTIAKAIESQTPHAESGNSPPSREPDYTKTGESGKTVGRDLEFHLPAIALRSHRDYVIAPAFGQKDGWFPLGDPSLIGGASGANKTTLMLDLLRAQALKMPFFGHETCGRPYLVLMFDRGENANKRTLERMGLMLDKIPIEYLSLMTGTAAAQAIVDKIEAADPLPQIVFIEGWDMLVKDANKMDVVAPFMREMQKIASHFHLALIGSVGAPKSKPGDGYISKRDSIFGSVAWSRMSETVMALQYPAGEDTSLQRELTVMLRNAPSESFSLIMKGGRLEIQTEADKVQVQTKETAHEIEWFKQQAQLGKADPSKKWWTVLDLERSLGVSDATAWRWTKNAHAKGYIVKKTGRRIGTKAAQFCWSESASNPLWAVEQQEQDEVEAHAMF
jgi:hypothetical protein